MTTASFRLTFAWDGKRPGKRVTPLNVSTRDEAVFYAVRFTVWSHAQGRPRKLPRYARFLVEEWNGAQWEAVREGTYRDATTEYREENTTVAEVGAIQFVPFSGSQARRAVGSAKAPGRGRGNTRLSQLVTKVLNDI